MILLLLLATVVGSALFAGLETGMVTLNRVRLRVRADRGEDSARVLLGYLERPERVLATFLVGNTLCNIGGGALATAWCVGRFGEAVGSLAATAVMTTVFLVFSEMVPKSLFRLQAEELLPRCLWFVRSATVLFFPVVWLLSGLLHLIGGRSGRSAFVTREELRQLVREAGARLGVGQKRMLDSVFDFGSTLVREVMIPLPKVVSLPEDAGCGELLDLVRSRGYTRIPLFRERVDQVTGLVTVFDLLYHEGELPPTVKSFVRPIHIVPETQTVPQILVDLQHRRESMALVVNEFGAIAGIVTVEDIVEEIFGELADEHEESDEPLRRVGDAYLLDASLDVDDLNEELGLGLEKDQFETVAGLLLKRLGRIPKVGEHVRVDNLDFEVLAVHQYGLRRLRLRVVETPKEGTGHDG